MKQQWSHSIGVKQQYLETELKTALDTDALEKGEPCGKHT